MAKLEFNHYPPEFKEKAFALFRKGLELQEIAERLQVPKHTLYGWSSRHKWQGRKALLAAGPEPSKVEYIAESSIDSRGGLVLDLTLAEQQKSYREGVAVQALRLPAIMAGLSDRELLAAADKLAKLGAEARKALGLETDKPAVVVNVALLANGRRARPIPSADARELPAVEAITIAEPTGCAPAPGQVDEPGA